MTEYINKEFYKEIPANERHYINLSASNIKAVMDKLNAEGIPFSATLSNYKNVVTVRKADSERAAAIVSELTPKQGSDVRIIGNIEYKYISDKRYINMDSETALKVAAILSGDSNNRFSGRIVGDKATITVSGDKAAADVRRIADNIKNADLLTELSEAGFERVEANNGFVNFRNKFTGDIEGFDSLDMVREMFEDKDNEFFHPTAYRIELTSDEYESDFYIISCYDNTTGEQIEPYYETNGAYRTMQTFRTVDAALEYASSQKITLSNPISEIDRWKETEAARENEQIEENKSLIADFPMQDGLYPDRFLHDPFNNSFIWVYFNPDGDNGNGEFVEHTIYEDDIYAAHTAMISAENEAEGRNAFINYIFENCRESAIDIYSGYFADYAKAYINKLEAVEEYYGIGANSTHIEDITALISRLEDSCAEIKKEQLESAAQTVETEKEISLSDQLVDLTDSIAKRQEEFTDCINTGNYEGASAAAAQLAELSRKAEQIKAMIQEETITTDDVEVLRSIKPERKSVQNMLETEVAQTPKFEKLLGEEFGEKSAYAMRNSDNEWRNDESKTVPVVEVGVHTLPNKITDLRKSENISKINRGTFTNRDTGISVIFGRNAVGEIIAKAIQDNKRERSVEARIAALYNMQELIENAICFDSEISSYDPVTSKNKSPNTLFMHKMYGVLNYNGEQYLADLTIEEMYSRNEINHNLQSTSNKLYSFRDIKITPTKLLGGQAHTGLQNANSDTSLGVTITPMKPGLNSRDQMSNDIGSVSIGATITIPQLYHLVKTYDQNFFENPSAPGRADREAEIKAQSDYRSAVEKYNEYVLTPDSDGIAIDGREGTWYVIDTQTIGGKELFLLESENYGDEAACLIVDGNRNIVMDNVHNGFEDYIEANIVPEGQMIISGEVASEMWYYGFDVYVNGEKLDKYDDVSDKNGTFGRLEDKENTISAAVNDVTLYHTADTIATAVFDISKKYFNAEKSISVPYYLNLEKYHEDNDWEDWRNDENEYANTMWSLLDRNYSNAENYFLNVIEASRENNKMAEDREAALKAMQTIDVFKAGMEEYRPANNKVTVLPVEEKSYTEQLYTRVNDEYSHFIGQMKKESPDMLVRSAAEIADKEKITQYILEGTASLSDEQYEALLSRENPLDEIYEQWVQNGELSSFEDVGIALEETANRILISLDRENSRSEEKVNAVLAVSQNDTNRYYVANNVSVDDVRKTITSSDKLFIDLCALGERQITEAQFAEYSQANGVTAVDVDIDEQTMHVYGADKPIVSFDEIKADYDEIAKALDLKNNTITFSVVAIEGEKPVVVGSYIDKDDITALEEYQDYIYDTGRKNIDVTVDYYTIGMGDNESYGADTDEKDFISEHLDEVLKYKYTDHLESETYFIATPAELLEEISAEKEKNYLFTVAEFEDGSRYVIPGEVGDDNIKDTAAWQDVKLNNFDIDNVSDLDEDIRVTYTVYQTGIGEAVIPTAEEAEKIEASLDEILSDAVVVDTDNSSVRPWDDVDDVISRMEEVWEERHEKEKNVSDGFDNSNFLYPNNLMKITHDIEGKDRYNFDDAILQIKLAGSEWLRPVDAVIEMNRRGVDINDIEMLNVRYVSSDGTVGEKDVTPEQYMVYLAHSEERTNAFLAAVNAAEERKKIPENIMKIIRDDMPSFVKSAVAWDELMEYDSISEKFDKGEDPVAVVKPYLASNGTFSWNADELKDGYFDWTVKDNGDTAVIFVSVNDSDTFREMYNSHFEVPWTEIADAFKQRIEQEKNYNKISDGTITVTAVGEDKFRFSDRSSNTEAIESREQLVERFAKMFNKAELESIINSVIGNAEYEEQSEPEKETPVEKSNSSTLIVNIYGGPGAGKSTTALQLAAELKKRGYHAEYIPEVAKDYVYAKNFDMLDGSLEHQKQIFAEQKQRVDLMIGNVDVAITDAPLTLNTIYMAPDEITPEYAAHILDEYNSYNNYNIYIDRDLSVEFEQEGRIHNLSESIEKDGEIKSMLISNDIAFDEFDRNNITGIADRVSSSLEHLKKIEQTKSKMKEMGIPYSDKPFNSTEKEDIYAYDGSMSLEDFRKRQLLNSESVDENANSPVGNLGGDEDKQIIDLSKLSKITLNDEYERGTDQPDDFRYIKNTITFSDLNSSFLIRRNKEFTYDYDVLPDLDEGDTFITRQGMLKEVQDFLEAAKSDSDKSISITDMNGNTTVLKGSQYVFEATEDRLAFVIPDAGYVEISERDDGSSDYVFYDNDFNTTDRGMYNDMDVTLRQALTFILKDAGYDIDKCKQMDFEELRSRAEEKTEKEKTIEASKYYIDNLLDVNVESMYYDPETETIHWYALDPNGDNGNGVFNEYVIDKDFAKEAIEQHIPDEIIGYVDGNCPNLTTAAISSQEFVKMADEHIRISEIAESESNDNYITIDYSSGDDVNKIVADFVKNKFELDIAQSRNSPVGNLYGDEEKQLEKAYEIYQIPAGERYHDIRFTSYDQLEKMGQLPDRFNYEMVYSGRLDDIDDNNKLEGIFIKFNIDRPKDFTGHSLSTSDVIVIEDEKGKSAYFVDDNGFKDITDIFLELDRLHEEEQDIEQVNISDYSTIRFVNRSEWDDMTLSDAENPAFEEITVSFSPNDDGSYTKHQYNKSNSAFVDTFEDESSVSGEEMLDELAKYLEIMELSNKPESYHFELTDLDGNSRTVNGNKLLFVMNEKQPEILENSVADNDLERSMEDGVIGSMGYPVDELHKAFEAENSRTDYEQTRKKSGSEIEVGDKFLYNDREYTVTSEKGIYPDDVGVSYEDNTGGIAYEITSNIDRYKLAENGVYLGNPEKERQTENSPVGNYENADGYEPKIGDLIEYQEKLFRIADINGDEATLQTADTLLPETTMVSVTDLITSDSLTVIEESGKPAPVKEAAAEQPAEDKPKAQNFVITDDDFGVAGGAKTRYADNVAAIKTLKEIEAENRTATPEEQEILSKYTGWGAIPQAFDINNDKWRTEYAELRTLLTPEEYAAVRKSTMNAHYTSPIVISAIYEGLKNLGFESGKILEPAVGIGNFFGVLPEEMRNSQLLGVELDSLTGRIAQQLYPEADIQIKGFEQTAFADNSFDVAIGNVPFGDYKVNDRKYNDNNFLIHDYFFAKALDKVRPGGVVAFVTSKGTLDKENPEVRKYLAQRAELLGAIRLPNNAFKANAGTEVTSDIIFLQKRERPIEINPDDVEWLKKAETPDGFSVNNYFVQHPEMVLGTIAEAKHIYGPTENTQVLPIEGADLKQQLSEAMKNIQGQYRAVEIETAPQNADEIPAPANSRKYSFYAVDGNLYYREAEDTMKKVTLPTDTLNRAIGLIGLRDNVRELLDLQLNNSDGSLNGDIAESRKALNDAYDSFVAKYGNVSDKKNAKAMQGDDGYNIVSALEIKDEKGKVTGKADIFTHDTVKPKTIAAHVDTAEEALILSISEKAKVDFEFMSELCGMDKDKLISELTGQIFRLPQEQEKYVTADEYLTGNIRKKLRELENAPEDMDVSENRKALEAAMPPRVEAKDISVKLGAHWVDPKYIEDFIKEKFNPNYETIRDMSVQYSAVAGTWKIEDVQAAAKKNYYSTQTYGTQRMHAYAILEAILNNRDIQVKDRVKDEYGYDVRDEKGNYVLVINDEETKAARRCANIIKAEFEDWIFRDPERREALVQKYNEVYNSIRHREYDGSHLSFVGMNRDITLKEHQKNAVARGLYGGNSLLAHAVGAGKTFEMIAIAMEGKRLGLHNKCLFAVPNALTEQMGNDFRKLYPNANILVATQKDFERENRLQLLGKIAANDWDAVIVGHSQFDRMGLSPERERAYLVAEVNKLRRELEMAAAESGGKKSFTVKQIEKSLASYESKLEKLNDAQVKDGFIDFEQLGFDKIFVDESHMYKNLATATKMHNVSGLGSQGSARAFNLLMKSKYLDEITGGRGLTFASGTPISNSMTELYTLMRYLQAGMLKDLGINHFDEWAADFGEVKTDYELKPESDGKYQLKTRFAKFTNLPELMAIFKEAADIRTADTLDLEKPKAVVTEVVAKPSKIQKRAIKSLGKRAAKIRNGNVDPRDDNMLKITSDGRKIGLDQRLLNPALPDDPESKVNLCVGNVFDIYTQTADKRSTQCIFCDLSTPKSETRQDRFIIYRPDSSKDLGYDIIRKKTGIKKDMDFAEIKKYVDKNASEDEDKLKNGDIAVIRRPSDDMTKIISEAAVFENGKFNPINSEELLEKLAMSPMEEMPPKEFNVYDDIKDKLVAKGVPEKEIAFIHDYDTPEQKQKLFNQMNAGEVRILLGSTAKCGAGMNAQQKMIALHHLDAPMRPSDMEQRNGRIERQGNENPEVQIFRYVTDKTFDAYLYQMLENKQKFISQVMTSKTPERTCADIDEQALDYAEVKALCAGNVLIKEEMQLQTQIKELKSEKSRYSEKIYELQDNIRVKIPAAIYAAELHIKHCKADFETAISSPKVKTEEGKEVYPIKIGDKVYTDRAEAAEALKEAVLKTIGRSAEGKTVPIGEYRGMKLSILFDSAFGTTKACLEGEKNHYCDLNLNSAIGSLIRLDNCINNIEKNIVQSQEKVDTMKAELEQMKIDVEIPFPKAEELRKAEARLDEVHEELTRFELTDDTLNKDIYERFTEAFPDVMFGKKEAMRFEAGEGWDTLSVELHGDVFSVAHTYEQNGDLMYDPLICFKVDYEKEKVIPVSYENSGMGIYETYDPDAEPTPQSVQQMASVLDFTDTWLDNIEQQGYEPVEDEDRSKSNDEMSM